MVYVSDQCCRIEYTICTQTNMGCGIDVDGYFILPCLYI